MTVGEKMVDIARLPCPFHLFQLPLGSFHEMEQQFDTIFSPTLSELLRIDLITDPICVWQAFEELCIGGHWVQRCHELMLIVAANG